MSRPVKTTRHLRASNRRRILQTIHAEGPISAAHLARVCELRPSTISNILKDLRQDGCIRYCGLGESTHQGGKRPTMIELEPDYGLLCGVGIRGNKCHFVLRDFALGPVDESIFSVDLGTDPPISRILDRLAAAIGDRPLLGAGIGAEPTPLADSAPDWAGDLAKALEKRWDCPVVVEEYAGLAACGEWIMHENRAAADLVFIDLPESDAKERHWGLGMILNGRLYHGRGAAGRLSKSLQHENGNAVPRLLEMVTGLLDPDLIVLGGAGHSPSGDTGKLADPTGPRIQSSRFGAFAVAEGGAAIAFDRLLEGS